MLPNWNLPWFPEWNRKNPTDVYGPAFIIGAVGGAIVFAALIVTWGNPAQTATQQTGPRGTAMGVTKYVSALDEGDPTIADYATTAPIKPTVVSRRAIDVIENAEPLLGDLTPENYQRIVGAMRDWTGIPDLFGPNENYQTVVARRMIQMTQFINQEWEAHVAPAGVNCYTCHRGQPVPSDIWFRMTPIHESVEGWSAVQNYASTQNVSTSLPLDALQKYLVEGELIAVHDLEPRVAGTPSDPSYRTWQDTERTYSLMNYFANSLGVNCTFCHNSRAFYDPAEYTPQWATASLGILMVQEMNNTYLDPLQDVYPDNRLGPMHGDAPKAACKTCHKGWNKPLQGLDMVSDWPELATTGAPSYD